MALEYSPVPANNRWPLDIVPTSARVIQDAGRFARPQTFIRPARTFWKRQSGAPVGRRSQILEAHPVTSRDKGVRVDRFGMVFGRRIPSDRMQGRGRWKTRGLLTSTKEYRVKYEEGKNMVHLLKSTKPARDRGPVNREQDSSRNLKRQRLRRLQMTSLPVRLKVSLPVCFSVYLYQCQSVCVYIDSNLHNQMIHLSLSLSLSLTSPSLDIVYLDFLLYKGRYQILE